MEEVVREGAVVVLDYTVHLDSGELVDSSAEDGNIEYIHGVGDIFPGMEDAIRGAGVGEKRSFVVPADRGYGEYRDDLVVNIEKRKFAPETTVRPGSVCYADLPNQGRVMMTIERASGDKVLCDFNHPLAGENLHFNVEILGVRDATDQEREQGYPESLADVEVQKSPAELGSD